MSLSPAPPVVAEVSFSETTEHHAGDDPRTSRAVLNALAAGLRGSVGRDFEVLEPLAIGGMATIFQLRHTVHGGLFVAKLLHADLAGRPGVLSSFRCEAEHAAQLGGHPNAVPIFGWGEVNGVPFMTMPFIEGEDLDRMLQQGGPLSRTETLQLAAQISSLLAHAESHGITHCDLAPGNIRLDVFGRYRVLDFGISHSSTANALPGFIGGTPLYTSPEQIRGEIPDIRSDIYALGAILCEVLVGKPLFHAASLADLRAKHLRGDWRLPAEAAADPLLSKLLHDMLATDRRKRFSSAFELSGALAAFGFERPEFRGKTERPAESAVRRNRLS